MMMKDLDLFEKNTPLNHVKSLAFKRLASTTGEIKALNYITAQLDTYHIQYSTEPFTWSKSNVFLMKFAFLFIGFYIGIYQALLFFPNFTWILLLLDGLLVAILYIGVKFLLDMTRIINIGKKKESKNVIAKIKAHTEKTKRPLIIFSAHYDTISLKYPFYLQLGLYISIALLSLIYLVLTLVLGIWSLLMLLNILALNDIYLLIRNLSLLLGFIALSIVILILLNKRKNKSVGAIDNATGVAILIELAKLLKKDPLNHADVVFLWAGAEEWGLWGSKQFCAKHYAHLREEYDLDRSYNINIDMVGTYIGLVEETGLLKKKLLNQNLNSVIESIAHQQKIALQKAFIPIGAGSDHMSFSSFAKKHGDSLQVSCLLSHKDGKYVHSKKDQPDLCSAEILNDTVRLCFNVVKSLDLRFE